MKTITKKALGILLAIALAIGIFSPIVATAAPLESLHIFGEEELESVVAHMENLAELFGVGMVSLTPEAKKIALTDFEYLHNKVMQIAPTQNIIARQLDIPSFDSLFGVYHQIIYNNIPIPTITSIYMGERWAGVHTEARYIAADYLFSLLMLFSFEFWGLGHMGPQALEAVEQMFFSAAFTAHHWPIALHPRDAIVRLWHLYYEIFNAPSSLWFYAVDESKFDFYIDWVDVLGAMDPDNVTTKIIEPGRIAYIRIQSFLNNIPLDAETLFPFYEEIQDFPHLILDFRGNTGGYVNSFLWNVLTMLIDESITFTYTEFYISNAITEAFFYAPICAAMGTVYGVFPAATYVRKNNLTLFNQDDLALLDYAIVWRAVYHPYVNNIPFNGQIWMLVDDWSASATEIAALIAIDTGFATVVGEPTAGISGVANTFASLPNTGILFRIDLGYTVDNYGRSFEEYGVVPQILNAEGMDALATVLAIIRTADIFSDIPIRHINGEAFVSVRLAAYAHNWTVAWSRAHRSAILVDPYGFEWILTAGNYGIINIDGTFYMPLANAREIFA